MRHLSTIALSGFILASCASSKSSISGIYREKTGSTLSNLQGELCSPSGFVIVERERLRMMTYYKNCDVVEIRDLKEYEPRQWGKKPRGLLPK